MEAQEGTNSDKANTNSQTNKFDHVGDENAHNAKKVLEALEGLTIEKALNAIEVAKRKMFMNTVFNMRD